MSEKLVVLGFLSHFPVAGVAWQTMHYLVGFERLGYEVYYVEAHGCTPSKLMRSDTDDGPLRAAEYIAGVMRLFGFERRWAYHALYESRYFGLGESELNELYRSAALLINLHGSHRPTPELAATGRLVFLETDPVDVQIDLHGGNQETREYLAPHCAFFTFGENVGKPDCGVPAPKEFDFHPTRQPVVVDFWEPYGRGDAGAFTTIGNWKQPFRERKLGGKIYHWSKHYEFLKVIDLPSRVAQPFELALSSYTDEDRRLLEGKGWKVRHALEFSRDVHAYRRYVAESRGEFTVAKDQNVRLRSGWFSDRAATYLAAGRPVITQETGFSGILPTGEGLFGFSNLEDIVRAVEEINGDYERHRRAALKIARECFSHDVVLGRLLADLGVSSPSARPAAAGRAPLPGDLVLAPVSRWPTRLAADTLARAADLRASAAERAPGRSRRRASVVVVTRDGLPYTRMCVASLLQRGWPEGDELIVVDNASTDGTREYLRDLARVNPFVRAQFNEVNRGFAAANNQGLALATGDILVLLNNDTLVPAGGLDGLARWLDDPDVGLVGPVTNRACNEAQIDAPYRTFGELERFCGEYTRKHAGQSSDIRMLAMFCIALRRDVFEQVGPLDEQFEIGMFEDDDYARRVRRAGLRVVCVEDVFVHHFGQATIGELCVTGDYDRILEANRKRFEDKWKTAWEPHARRISPEYQVLRRKIREAAVASLPADATVVVISKGDDELLEMDGRRAWHFPRDEAGRYANVYPADSAAAIAHLETLRAAGATHLLIPKPAFWWLEHYSGFRDHLSRACGPAAREDDICMIFRFNPEQDRA
jgi:GT2 family glycosyltransferase